MTDLAVLIVGAGPTGLTLAVDLARRGVRCRVVDKAPGHFTGSRGKGLQPRTQEVFDDLGVYEQVRAAGGAYPTLRAYDGPTVLGDQVMFEQRAATPDVPYANLLMVPQWRTEQILRERLAGLGVTVELGTTVTHLEQDADEVTATLDGSEPVRARYLVGADGGRSFVRRALGVGFHGETLEAHRALIGDVGVDGLDRDRWHVWPAAPGGMMSLCPMPGTDSFQFTVQLAGADPDLTLAALQRIVDERTGRTDLRLRDLTFASPYRVNVRMVDRYRVGRAFLAGDAAHVHPPAGGQGLNTGVQDAYNLGWKLGAVLAGAPDGLLDSYQAERLPVAAEVLGLSSVLLAHGAQGRHGDETSQLALNYRGGPLAGPSEGGTLLATGDRAPDAPGHDLAGAPVRLFDAFRGPHATLLGFGPDAGAAAGGLAGRYGDAVRATAVVEPGERSVNAFVDTAGHANRGYGVRPGAFVLVRPDGYLGLTSTDAAEVDRYLDQAGAPAMH